MHNMKLMKFQEIREKIKLVEKNITITMPTYLRKYSDYIFSLNPIKIEEFNEKIRI